MANAARHEVFHILFEDSLIKWKWHESELIRFRQMWQEGADLLEIAKEFKTDERSIALVVMDQAEQGEIEPRAGGLFG